MKVMLTFPARRGTGNAIIAHWASNKRQVGVCTLTDDAELSPWMAVLLAEGNEGERVDCIRLYAAFFGELCDRVGAHLREHGPWWM